MSEHGDRLADWLRSGRYLPAPLRDFHDQKEAFKSLWERVERRKAADPSAASYLGGITWVAAQVLVIDHFLWFMAAHGWTLQRSRAPVMRFDDLSETIKERREREGAAFRKAMLDDHASRQAPPTGSGAT